MGTFRNSAMDALAGVFRIPAVLAFSDEAQTQKLILQIEAMAARVTALEIRIAFVSFMPDLVERFHVMHRSVAHNEWASASHELRGMRQLVDRWTSVDAENGRFMAHIMTPSLDALGEAIEHNDYEGFADALAQSLEACKTYYIAAVRLRGFVTEPTSFWQLGCANTVGNVLVGTVMYNRGIST